jgi:hypothetical protein
MKKAKRIKPIYKVVIERCIDNRSFVVDVVTIGSHTSSPGRWLRNRAEAQLWAVWAIEWNMWRSLRRWKNSRSYLV